MTISAIYLAAGFSKRFGENKLLHEIDGKPMYQYTLEKLISIWQEKTLISQVIVVTQYDEIEQYIVQQNTFLRGAMKDNANEIQVVRNMHSERGIASSLQLGIQAAGDADAYLFCVADQPYLKKETIENFVKGYIAAGKGIGCLSWGERYGNPTIFDRKYKEELLGLSGDIGGRQIVSNNPEDVYRYEVTDAYELRDIDFGNEFGSEFRSGLQ